MKNAIVNLMLVLSLLVVGVWVHGQSTKAEGALCTLRADLQRRQAESRAYLDDLKEGRRAPIPGISNADIARSIVNQQQTINALSSLDCK